MKNRFSNKIAIKLTMYFAAVLLTFSLIMGGLFYQYFKQHNVDVTKKEMNLRATKIAEVISKDLDWLQGRYGDRISQSRFVNSLDNAMQEVVWVVDSEYNLNMNMDVVRKFQARSGKHHERLQRFIPKDSKDAYRKLPQNIKEQVELAFKGHSFILEDYNPFLEDTMLTVGAPVYDKNGVVKAVVMLHSPVQGTKDAVWAGLRILFYSMLAALVLVSVLSIVLSWRFTNPLNKMKEIAMRLADKDYKARCDIEQNDEIGELANTLDVLSERLQLADEESQKLEKLRREFIANISHELRTPVTVIRGSLEALRDGVIPEPEEVEEYHDQMLSESVFLQRLINDLLDLSRLQNMDFPIEKEPLNLCDVVQDAVRSEDDANPDVEACLKAYVNKVKSSAGLVLNIDYNAVLPDSISGGESTESGDSTNNNTESTIASVTGVITDIRTAVMGGESVYFIELDDKGVYYSIEASDNAAVVILNKGDTVTVTVDADAEGDIVEAISIK